MPLTDTPRNFRPETFLLALVALGLTGCASVRPAEHSCFHRNAAIENDIGYCAAVRAGETLYVSGMVGQGEMATAVRQSYEKLQETLKAHGLTFADVVKETVYTTDLDAFKSQRDVRKEFYGATMPAATWVQVDRLFESEYVVEVELTAAYPKRGR